MVLALPASGPASGGQPYKTPSHGASAGRDESQNRCRIAPAIREKSKFSCHLSYPPHLRRPSRLVVCGGGPRRSRCRGNRSEEHTSELQSLMRISYAVFCLTKKNKPRPHTTQPIH